MKQTAVEWLQEQYYESWGILTKEDFEQAKEMEKEQIMDAWENWDKHEPCITGTKSGNVCLADTFPNSKLDISRNK